MTSWTKIIDVGLRTRGLVLFWLRPRTFLPFKKAWLTDSAGAVYAMGLAQMQR